jgi:hypothetical protein
MNEAIIHATCTRIREAKGLSKCFQCPERDLLRDGSEGEPYCHLIARVAWDKEAEFD